MDKQFHQLGTTSLPGGPVSPRAARRVSVEGKRSMEWVCKI